MQIHDAVGVESTDTTTVVGKRAQWEAFDYDVLNVGRVRVTNRSHGTTSPTSTRTPSPSTPRPA
jgi:hypothetical protein